MACHSTAMRSDATPTRNWKAKGEMSPLREIRWGALERPTRWGGHLRGEPNASSPGVFIVTLASPSLPVAQTAGKPITLGGARQCMAALVNHPWKIVEPRPQQCNSHEGNPEPPEPVSD